MTVVIKEQLINKTRNSAQVYQRAILFFSFFSSFFSMDIKVHRSIQNLLKHPRWMEL